MACAYVAAGSACSVSFAAPSSAVSSGSSSSSVSGSYQRVRFHLPVRSAPVRPASKRSCRVVAMASPPKTPGVFDDLVDKIKESISTAQEACFGNEDSEECVVAWDEVEELSAAAAHKREGGPAGDGKKQDPLDKYCEDNPESDECRVYED